MLITCATRIEFTFNHPRKCHGKEPKLLRKALSRERKEKKNDEKRERRRNKKERAQLLKNGQSPSLDKEQDQTD
jgi:hypothetical protein